MFSGLFKTHMQLDPREKTEIAGVIFRVWWFENCISLLSLYIEYPPQHILIDLEDVK